jgi:serine/threonine protein kinase
MLLLYIYFLSDYTRLSTTVKKNASESDLYELSGCTGSYRYMAPEVALNKAYNEKVDIYSYGLILYEALTGVTPFQEDCKDNFYIRVVYGNERPVFDQDEFGNPITSIEMSKLACMNNGDDCHEPGG